jgi:hypothetical protein
MKHTSFFLLSFIVLSVQAQVVTIELFPENVNGHSPFNLSSPSMNDSENRLCFIMVLSLTTEAIMISDKIAEGKWSDPYSIIQFGEDDILLGCSISADGDQVYFGLNNDIYRIEYTGGKWSKPQPVGSPVSMEETLEAYPSISRDNQSLSFIRNIRVADDWAFTPFISIRKGNTWLDTQEITIRELADEELYAFYCDNENKNVFFSSGTSQSDWGNYYGVLENSICVTIGKIDFTGGYITWMSKDYTTGLVITATQPSGIARIKFSTPLVDLVSKKK